MLRAGWRLRFDKRLGPAASRGAALIGAGSADFAKQTSRGKLNRLRCTTAGSTLRVLDGYGLRDQLPARPTLAPRIRFLFIGSHLCSTLPSDPASRRQPLRFTNPSPPSDWVEDFHLRAIEHARHTTKPLRGSTGGTGLFTSCIPSSTSSPSVRISVKDVASAMARAF